VPAPVLARAKVVALPLVMAPLIVLALVFVPVRVRVSVLLVVLLEMPPAMTSVLPESVALLEIVKAPAVVVEAGVRTSGALTVNVLPVPASVERTERLPLLANVMVLPASAPSVNVLAFVSICRLPGVAFDERVTLPDSAMLKSPVSAATGTVPPQFPAVLKSPPVALPQVRVAACAGAARRVRRRKAKKKLRAETRELEKEGREECRASSVECRVPCGLPGLSAEIVFMGMEELLFCGKNSQMEGRCKKYLLKIAKIMLLLHFVSRLGKVSHGGERPADCDLSGRHFV